MNRILVVDDNESIRLLYTDELTEEGYDVITNSGDSQLMALIKEKMPDLIVLDMKLGKYNGSDFVQTIRNKGCNLPVILCTAYPAFEYDLKSVAADYYVVKSSDLSELKVTVKKALESEVSAHEY